MMVNGCLLWCFLVIEAQWRKMLPNSRSQLSCGAVLSVSGSAPTHKVGSEVNNAMFKLGLLVQACLTADKNGCPF